MIIHLKGSYRIHIQPTWLDLAGSEASHHFPLQTWFIELPHSRSNSLNPQKRGEKTAVISNFARTTSCRTPSPERRGARRAPHTARREGVKELRPPHTETAQTSGGDAGRGSRGKERKREERRGVLIDLFATTHKSTLRLFKVVCRKDPTNGQADDTNSPPLNRAMHRDVKSIFLISILFIYIFAS